MDREGHFGLKFSWTGENVWATAGKSLPQAASAALPDTFEGWKDDSQRVCLLTPWVMQRAGFPPCHTQTV